MEALPEHTFVALSDVGEAVDAAINNIPKRQKGVFLDKYVIMPNHVHLILILANDTARRSTGGRQVAAPTKTVSTIVAGMKRFASMRCGRSVWQKSFHDHVIRNEYDYRQMVEYIENNPLMWTHDCFYPKRESLSCTMG
ncbi:MAG: transposase [Burkholderiaceae bacterium]|nr:transposase [Burkholderiaceae bacterium]